MTYDSECWREPLLDEELTYELDPEDERTFPAENHALIEARNDHPLAPGDCYRCSTPDHRLNVGALVAPLLAGDGPDLEFAEYWVSAIVAQFEGV